MKFIKFMKFYFFFIALKFITNLFFDITDGESLGVIYYLDYIFCAIALTGVFGYSFSKDTVNLKFWQFFLPFIIIWDSYIYVTAFWNLYIPFYLISNDPNFSSNEFSVFSFIVPAAVLWLFFLPSYIALYLYGYKNGSS